MFLETAITINLLGDKLSLWLGFLLILNNLVCILLFIVPWMIERRQKKKLLQKKSESGSESQN